MDPRVGLVVTISAGLALIGWTSPLIFGVVALTSLCWLLLIWFVFYRTPKKGRRDGRNT